MSDHAIYEARIRVQPSPDQIADLIFSLMPGDEDASALDHHRVAKLTAQFQALLGAALSGDANGFNILICEGAELEMPVRNEEIRYASALLQHFLSSPIADGLLYRWPTLAADARNSAVIQTLLSGAPFNITKH